MIDPEADFKLLVKSLTPHAKERLIRYFEALRSAKLETIEMAQDEIIVRRAQGASLAYKDLVKSFTE